MKDSGGNFRDSGLSSPVAVQTGMANVAADVVKWARGMLGLQEARIALVALCLAAVISLVNPKFMTLENWLNILRQASVVSIVAFGATFVLVAGEFDMSVGALLSLCGCLGGLLAARGAGPVEVLAVAVLVGAVAGCFNGVLVSLLGINAFVATLGTMMLFRGMSDIVTGGLIVSLHKFHSITYLGKGFLGPFPVLVIFMSVVLLICQFLISMTRFGRWVYAVGGNIVASEYSAVPVRYVKCLVFAIGGACAGLAGLLLAARVGATTSTLGIGYEFDAIAAVVLGGTPIGGGRGTVWGTFLGAVFVGILRAGLTLLGVATETQMIAIGAVLIGGVAMAALRSRR